MYVHIICMKAFTLSRRSTRKYSPLVVVCVLSIVRKGLKSFKMEIQCNDLTHALARRILPRQPVYIIYWNFKSKPKGLSELN